MVKTRHRWTEEDNRRLQAAYRSGGLAAAQAAFPDRKAGSVAAHIYRLGISWEPFCGKPYRRWTSAELDRLKAAYVRGGLRGAAAEFPDYKLSAIKSLIYKFGIVAECLRATIQEELDFDPKPETRARRTCLRCDREFPSNGNWNRICPLCAPINARAVEINASAGIGVE